MHLQSYMIPLKTYHPLNLFPIGLVRLMIFFAILFCGNTLAAQQNPIFEDSLVNNSLQISEVKSSSKSDIVNNHLHKVKTKKKVDLKQSESKFTIYITDGAAIFGFEDHQSVDIVNLQNGTNQKILAKSHSKKKKLEQEKNILSKKEYKNPIFTQVIHYHSPENTSHFSSRDVTRNNAVVPNVHKQNKESIAILNDFYASIFYNLKVDNTLFKNIFFKENKALKTFYTRPPPFFWI